jgi:hypothetical protein
LTFDFSFTPLRLCAILLKIYLFLISMRYFFILIFTLAVCFAFQALGLKSMGGRTLKSESNFFSSVGRIQAGARAKQDIMVLGSSITGRLPDVAQGFFGISNMGCDGGNGIDSLRAIDKGILPSARWIYLEANTLQLSLNPRPTEISRTMQGEWFQYGIEHPSISAYARPAAFFYSKLLSKKIGKYAAYDADRGFGFNNLPSPAIAPPNADLTPTQKTLINETSKIILRLREKGSEVIFVWLPPARANDQQLPWILSMASASQSYWWDLGQSVPKKEIKLTDGVHMDATSATRTTGELLSAIEQLNSN